MKTYCFEEVLAHGEITEWVPADVARELFEALKKSKRELHACQAVIHLHGGFDPLYVTDAQQSLSQTDKAIKHACGES